VQPAGDNINYSFEEYSQSPALKPLSEYLLKLQLTSIATSIAPGEAINVLLRACLHAVKALNALHLKGLYHSDLHLGRLLVRVVVVVLYISMFV